MEGHEKLRGLHSGASRASATPQAVRITGNGERCRGLAALLQAFRWIADIRNEYTGGRLDSLEDPLHLCCCHTIMNCTRTCPKVLNSAQTIQEIKKLMA